VNQQPTRQPSGNAFTNAVPWLLPALVIGNFLWRVFTPAHEYPMRDAQLLEMGIDALCIAGLFGVKKRMATWLFWAALICGIGLFAIRLNSDASWWTGHLMYSLPPR
jgi:hypothetical protein